MSEIEKLDLSGDGGVLKELVKEGTGDERPMSGCQVALHYTGKLTDGTVFDSSVDRGEPFEFQLGKGSVIRAFDMGVATMKLGEKCILTCAADYAYGASGSPPSIPPNATLIFELEMMGWKGEDISPNSDGSIERCIVVPSEKRRTPTQGALLKIHLIGRYEDRVFEERDVEFNLGEGNDCGVVDGVELALEKISVGETSRLKIQHQYAFGSEGHEEFKIPPRATVVYEVKLLECERGTQEWKLSDSERIEQSKLYKEKGTKYFGKQNFKLAIKMYKQCVDILPKAKSLKSGEESLEAKQLRIAAYGNLALCYQKTDDDLEAKHACDEVLKLDANNVKAYFRRGRSNLNSNDFEEALDDFKKLLELDPTNKAAVSHIAMCRRKIKESNEKERKMYANMFEKMAAAEIQPPPTMEPDVLSKCGEWTEEDAKREVDLALENENIVMI